ncbi:MAG: hypothetical protein KAX49_14760 [Halanaerobiales bacterium]|nr:hypothetical protein [Halanaerobiales bacterium]
MNGDFVLSPEKYYEEAKNMLKKKDFVEFVSKISVAVESSHNDKDMLAKTSFLKVKGLIVFNQYRKALKNISEALKHNEGIEEFKLTKYRGVALGYLGELKQAINIFKELLTKTDDINLLVETYINIVWAYLSLNRIESKEENLKEAKLYLDLINKHVDCLNSQKLRQLYTNYSDYYYFVGDYNKAIELQQKAIDFCEEENLPKVYNNLAELHLKYDEFDIVEKYVHDAEVLAYEYDNSFEFAQSQYILGMAYQKDKQFLNAKDCLYVALAYFCKAQAYTYAFNCFKKMLEISQVFNIESIKLLEKSVKVYFEDTPFHQNF